MKAVTFWGDSLDQIRKFPEAACQEAGFQIHRVQCGQDPDDWRPMRSVGAGVKEIRVREASGIFRVIYVAQIGDKIHVLHAFQKKSQKTAKSDLDLAKRRLKQLLKG